MTMFKNYRIHTTIITLLTVNVLMFGANYKPISNEDIDCKGKKFVFGKHEFVQQCDSTFENFYFVLSGSKNQIIDSVEYSAYGSMIYAYNSKASKDTIIVWSIENEYYADLHLYYLNNGIVHKMGELAPLLVCKDCETVYYPISGIRLIDDKSTIKVVFELPVEFKDIKDIKGMTKKPFIVYDKNELLSRMHLR